MIAVTGSSGWVGGAVVRYLQANGHSVLPLARFPLDPTAIPFDMLDHRWRKRWPETLSGCSAIIHCAAHVHRATETAEEKARFHDVNVIGTERLLTAASLAGVRRVVLVSTIAVYDWSECGVPRAENAKIGPSTAYGASKLAAERIVQQGAEDWRIGRLATVFGVGDHANFAKLASALRRRRMIIPDKGSAKKSVIAVDRAAEILGRLAIARETRGRILNVSSPCVPTLADICAGFTQVCGFSSAPQIPTKLLWPLAKMGDIFYAIGAGSVPFSSESLRKLTSDTVVDTTVLQSLFPDLQWANFADELARAREYYVAQL